MNQHTHSSRKYSARLSIRLLGAPQLLLDNAAPRSKFYGKVLALLAYLCAEADRSHAREELAALLWPAAPAETARGSLRQALRHLRQALGTLAPEVLQVSRDTLRFRVAHSECHVDIALLTAPLPECPHCAGPASSAPCDDCLAGLEARQALYQGDFLAGLRLPDAPEFETWLNLKRQSLRGHAFLLAERLCGAGESAGRAEMALTHARRCLELEPWNEAAHRRYMRLLAGHGQPAAAQLHYDAYRVSLAHELNVEPDTPTQALFESIHRRGLRTGPALAPLPETPQRLPHPRAARRQVTALCCHLDLPSDSHEPDLERLAESRAVCVAVLRRHAGHIAQGHDGYLYAYLGYPAASEQAGRQAVLAAQELQSCFGPPYRFRAGIHTGMIITGLDPAVPDIIGTVSLAAWQLCGSMEEGGIALSAATARLLRDRFALLPLQALETGEQAATETAAYRLPVSDSAEVPVAVHSFVAPLIGRRPELQRLRTLWRRAARGHLQRALLRGEAGMGKTRLACTVLDEALQGGALVRQLNGYPEHRHTPLYPLVAMVENTLGFTFDDTPASQRGKLKEYLRAHHPAAAPAAEPVLMMLLSIAPADTPVPSPQQCRQQTLDMMLLLLDSLASTRPVLLLVEDAHWLDVTTLDLLQRLLKRESPVPLFTLITARPEFRPAWLADEAVLDLQPLPDTDIARVARAAGGPLPAAAIAAIVKRAEGIPFYAEEMARLHGGAPDWPLHIPPTLRDLLSSRLDTVPHARRIVQLAATIGRRFEQGLLQRVSGLNTAALAPILRQLTDNHLITVGGPPAGTLQFSHALIQEVAYETQVQADCQDAHRRVADTLSRQYPQLAAQRPGEVARHYALAGVAVAAVPWWLEAGRQALRVSAGSEARAHLDEGLVLLAQLSPGAYRDAQELALLLALGQAVQLGQGYGAHEAARIYDRACELSHDDLTLKQRFEIQWGLWTVASSRPGYGFLKARDLAQNLLELAGRSGDSELLAKAHTANANVALWLNSPEEVCRHADAAIAQAGGHVQTTLGGLDPVVACLAYASWAQWRQGRSADARAASARALARARELGNPDTLCIALGFAAMLQRFLGNVQAVAVLTGELQAHAAAHGLATWQGLGRMLHAWLQVRQGDENGIDMLQACAQGIQQIMPSVAPLFLHALAEALGMLQRHDAQVQAVEKGLEVAARVDERFFGSLLEDLSDTRPA